LPLAVGVDFGAGAGLQAVATALLNRDVAALYLFETQDFMIDSIVDLFDANGVDNYYLNVPLDQPADLFYSFKACGYLFGVETYFEQIRQNRSANARALMDIGYTQNLDQQRAKLMSIFRQSATMYRYGEAPYDSARTLFDEPY